MSSAADAYTRLDTDAFAIRADGTTGLTITLTNKKDGKPACFDLQSLGGDRYYFVHGGRRVLVHWFM